VSTKTILIADDTAFVRDRFSAALTDAGHRAVPVVSVSELLDALRPGHPPIDLILLDLQLPPARGIGLVRAIRERGAPEVPILVFSGTVTSADQVRTLADLGVAGYINEYSAPAHILPSLAPHLFPDKFDRRGSPRVAVSAAVSYRVGNAIASALTLAIGKGGLGIRTMNPLERGSVARLRFRLPGVGRDVEAEARVCWADRNIGMGLVFEHVSAADQAAIDDYVDGHFFSNRRG